MLFSTQNYENSNLYKTNNLNNLQGIKKGYFK